MMNKMIKKISAVAIAAAMTLSSGVAAQAATVQVYFRQWEQTSSENTYLGEENTETFGTAPVFTVTGVESGDTYKEVLETAASDSKGKYKLAWTGDKNQYLNTITINGKEWGVTGGNINPTYDSTGKMISATWVGTAWSWYEGSNIYLKNISSYPKTTLGETLVPVTTEDNDNEIISMVLSYDKTQFDWHD